MRTDPAGQAFSPLFPSTYEWVGDSVVGTLVGVPVVGVTVGVDELNCEAFVGMKVGTAVRGCSVGSTAGVGVGHFPQLFGQHAMSDL